MLTALWVRMKSGVERWTVSYKFANFASDKASSFPFEVVTNNDYRAHGEAFLAARLQYDHQDE